MVKEIKCYKCLHCNCIYETKEAAIGCLESHNLVYRIQEYISDHDCWGRLDGSYVDTDTIFKLYSDAESYIKNNTNLRIKGVKLL